MPRILIADDHTITRSAVRALLKQRKDLEICGEATNAEEAVARALELSPELIIMDIEMPGKGSLVAVRTIKEACPATKILVYSIHDDRQWVQTAALVGASGYVVKGRAHDLLAAVDAVLRNETSFPGEFEWRSLAQLTYDSSNW